ncbi:MAG: S1 family peptidase [Pseudomonadota bacterium]
MITRHNCTQEKETWQILITNMMKYLVSTLLLWNQCLVFLGLLLLLPAYAIIGGSPTGNPPDSPALRTDPNLIASPWTGVGSISIGNGVFSGVLISPHHVLTAAHVVAGQHLSNIVFNLNAGSDLSHRLPAARIFIHPNYATIKPTADSINHNDLAVIELAEAAPAGVPIYPILMQSIPLGTIITFVGYGAGGDGLQGVTVRSTASIKRVGANRVEQLLPSNTAAAQQDVYLFRFDNPARTDLQYSDALGNNVAATLAYGDSGSPVFVKIPLGGWHLVGVNTFVMRLPKGPENRQKFGNGGGGMLLYPQLTWIKSLIHSTH